MADEVPGIYEWDRRSFGDDGEIESYLETNFADGNLARLQLWLEDVGDNASDEQKQLAEEASVLLEAAISSADDAIGSDDGIDARLIEKLILIGVKIGSLGEMIRVLQFDGLAASGRKAKRPGSRNSGSVSVQDRVSIRTQIDTFVTQGFSRAVAAAKVNELLLRGECPGIDRVVDDQDPDTMRRSGYGK